MVEVDTRVQAAPKRINLRARAVAGGSNPVPVAQDKPAKRRPVPVAAEQDKAVKVELNPVRVVLDKAVEAVINSAVGTIHPPQSIRAIS